MRWLAFVWLRMLGWQFHGSLPPDPKFVAIAAPHTSNWDFVVLLGAMWHWRVKEVRFLAWAGLFRWPLGLLLRRLGGIPVSQDHPRDAVRTAANAFDAAGSMNLVITPESARRRMPYWRSGFYRIALAADVPVLLAYVDRNAKRGGIGALIALSGDRARDMDRIRAYYASVIAAPPEGMGPVRLRDELSRPGD